MMYISGEYSQLYNPGVGVCSKHAKGRDYDDDVIVLAVTFDTIKPNIIELGFGRD